MLIGDGFPVLRQEGHGVVGVLGTDSLIKDVHHALLFTVVNDAKDIVGHFLQVVGGARLLCSSP